MHVGNVESCLVLLSYNYSFRFSNFTLPVRNNPLHDIVGKGEEVTCTRHKLGCLIPHILAPSGSGSEYTQPSLHLLGKYRT